MNKIKLSEIIDTIQGSQFPIEEQEFEEKEGYKQFLRISDYTKDDEIPRYVKYSGKEYVCDNDSVVVVRYGNIGFIGYGKEGILANNLFALKVKENVAIKNKYLYYFLNSNHINQSLITKANTSTMPALTHKMIKDLEIRLHSLNEQEKIISTLDKVSNIIEVRKKQLGELDELVKSQFVEMFGSVELNDKKFEEKEISSIADISSSKRIYANEYRENGVPFYRSKEIIELGHNKKPSIELFISTKRYEEIKEKYGIPNRGDILITAVGTIGETWIVDTDEPFYYKDGNVLQIRLNTNISQIYFKYVLDILINIFKSKNVSGSAYSALTIEKFKKMKIILPPIELQNQFADIVKQIDKQKFELQKSLEEIKKLQESLMNKYFG